MMNPIPLTPDQIKTLDEIGLDRRSADETLKIALNFHANQINRIEKFEKAFWDGLAEAHGLDYSVKQYTIDSVNRQVCVVEKED